MHQFLGRDKQRGDNGNEKMDAALFWTSELLGVVSMMMMMVMMIGRVPDSKAVKSSPYKGHLSFHMILIAS